MLHLARATLINELEEALFETMPENEEPNVKVTIPGVGWLIDIEDVDILAFAVSSFSCEDLERLREVAPPEHRALIEAAMKERGCPVRR